MTKNMTVMTIIIALSLTVLSLTACSKSGTAPERELQLTGPTGSFGFMISNSGDAYSVYAGTAITGAVNIPAYYRPNDAGDYLPVTVIAHNAFNGCVNLTAITIPATVTEIGYGAFALCPSLAAVTIPASVTKTGTGAFALWTGGQTIRIEGRADREAVIAAGWLETWDDNCKATIIYNGR
jgi:hypothetical protein